MSLTQEQLADGRWRDALTAVFPELAVQSFCGPDATARWIEEQVNDEIEEASDGKEK